ncbi:DOCK2 (predicted), partial [Pycnogonum litorale]
VLYNYKGITEHCLTLNIGETVYIHGELQDWYFGCLTHSRKKNGIFPKTYIRIKPAVIDRTGPQEVIIAREAPIVQEITSVLREWGAIWKQLFIDKCQAEFDAIRVMMYELIGWRRQIMSGTLPVDELKEFKQKVTSKIDMGNALLGLDLIVRDDQGNILNPDVSSTIHLYRRHEVATQRIQRSKISRNNKSKRSSSHVCHSLFVTVKNFVCRIGEDADVLMTLYDSRENRFISENYLVKWGKEGLAQDLDQLNNLHVLFTDLGSKDLIREKVYLVCQIIRIGSMELKEQTDHKRSTVYSKKTSEGVRRPFGVAVMDISDVINGIVDYDEEKQHFVPFIQCGERDFLENVIRKMIGVKDVNQKDHKGQGLWICLKLLHGDMKQCKEENPHIFSMNVSIARKMGFPEIILPGDIRNDLYLTLVQGEYSKGSSKSSERNVEVTVSVCNDKGQTIKIVVSMGAGSNNQDFYRSVVYYHEDKPRWFETIKVAIPIEEFYNAHLKFLFRHRSSNEAKDKAEKPFALSYTKLMLENGTILTDRTHELLVYKIDHKKYDAGSVGYLSLPSNKQELMNIQNGSQSGLSNSFGSISNSGTLKHGMLQLAGMSLCSKDSFHISTLVCSTKFTANVDLLGLLKWRINPDNLKLTLLSLMKVDGEEIVKFLQDTLDALFNILMQNPDKDLYDNLVFEALIFIIGLIADRKYQHFRPILDVYITENFSATLADKKLMLVLRHYIDNASCKEGTDLLLKTMKSLEYIIKFIVRSRMMFSALNEGKGQAQFEISFKLLMQSISGLMLHTTDLTLTVQGACMKYLPCTLSDILKVFDAKELSYLMTDFINNVPVDRLTKQKMMCINDIIYCDMFKKPECRAILLPVINDHIKLLLESGLEEELCVKILGDIMLVLNCDDMGSTENDITDIMLSMLRSIIQCVIHMKRNTLLIANLVGVMIDILRQMTQYHYDLYIKHFPTRTDLIDFLIEILMVFKDLVSNSVYPRDWNEMILLQNCVMLKALRYFSHTIRDEFSSPFEFHVWDNFFHCAIAFLTQNALQLENFSQNKRVKIISRYKDMRRETGFEIRSMWFNLGQHKIHFVPGMVGPFLEMTLIPEIELRKATIPIFFDMMQCEFYSSKHGSTSSLHSSIISNQSDGRDCKGNFHEFENEIITQLDVLIEGGRGDEQYKDLFYGCLSEMCKNHFTMHDHGMRFVKMVHRLMERLLEYRSIMLDEQKENRMSCTVNLLEFYNEINRKEMYIRYLHKLCDLHLDCDNYTEAAFTLKLHAKLLRWTDDILHPILRSNKYPDYETHRELKERLYLDIIEYFNKGRMWEAGLTVCKELAAQYEHEVFDYPQLSALLTRMSVFYDKIMKQMRPEAEYFRVGYYGLGFPVFLKNKVFIHRGKEYERLSDFSSHLQNIFPYAQLMTKLAPPSEEITQSSQQYLQINKVDPIMEDKRNFAGKVLNPQILRYYQVNEVQKFTYSRPVRRGDRNSDNEFATMWIERTNLVTSYPLPGILRWFPVTSSHVFEISPLENAIETMTNTNVKIRNAVLQHTNDINVPINPLSMLLNGIVDAAVMGGISNYEKAFFTADYLENNPSRKELDNINKLKDLIAKQIPLLEAGIKVHKQKAPESLKPFHEHMEQSFNKLSASVEEKYGKRVGLITFGLSVFLTL